jgi:L-serine/L-threonine ammonia-lyase
MSRNSKQKTKQNSINGNINRALESNIESKVDNPPSPLIHNPSHINDQCFHIVSPLIFSTELSKLANCQVWLKLENLQPAGSHKVRGIGAYCLRQYNLGITQFYCSEGSNSCIATAYIGRQLECKVTAIVPENCSKHILALLKVHHAEILKYGTSWEDATLQAKTLQMHNPDSCFVSSYDHADIWEGNKSIITEIGKQIGDTPVGGVVLGVGGGGLLSGVVMGMEEAGLENVPIVAVETHGCNSLQQSVYAEKVLTLQMSNTKAESLAQRRVCSKAFESCFAHPVIPVSVSDNMAANGIVQFASKPKSLK